MAVDFSVNSTGVNSQVESPSRVVQPVTHDSEVSALNRIGVGLGVAARTMAQALQYGEVTAQNKRVAEFVNQFEAINAGADQGAYPAQEARIRQRALLTSTIANNPNMTDEILKVHSRLLNDSGYNKVDTPAVEMQQQQKAIVSEAVKNGWIPIADVNDPNKVAAGLAKQQNYNNTVQQLELNMKQLDQKSKGYEVGSKEYEAIQRDKKDVAELGLRKVAATSIDYYGNKFKDWSTKIANATDPATKQALIKQATIDFDQDYTRQTAMLSGETNGIVDTARIDAIRNPVKDLIDVYKKQLTGEYDTETATKALKNQQAILEINAWNKLSENGRMYISAANLLKDGGAMVFQQKIYAEAANMFADNAKSAGGDGSKPVDVVQPKGDHKNISNYFDGVATFMKKANNGEFKPESKKEIDDQLKSILSGVQSYGPGAKGADEFTPVVDFLTNPEVGKYLKNNTVPKEFYDKAREVIQAGYDSQVIPLLRDEFQAQKNKVVGRNVVKSFKFGDVADPVFDNGKFGWQPKEGVNDPYFVNWIKSQNGSAFAKVMNKMIMLDAHLSGNTDYGKSAEEIIPFIINPANTGSDKESKDEKKVDNTKTGSISLNDIVHSKNPDVIQEVMDAGEIRNSYNADAAKAGVDDNNLDKFIEAKPKGLAALVSSDKRGYTPDLENVRPAVKDKLRELQNAVGYNLPIVSGYRGEARNKAAGGAKHSQHLSGNAVDIDVADLGRSQRIDLIKKAREAGFTGIGVYGNSLHFDLGRRRAWGPSYHSNSIPAWAMAAVNGDE